MLPFRGLDKCVQMLVVSKQQVYNGLCSGSPQFIELLEASGIAKWQEQFFKEGALLGEKKVSICNRAALLQ